jgi:hypothetical protein
MDLLEPYEEEDFDPRGEIETYLDDPNEKSYKIFPPNDSDFNFNDNDEEINEISERDYCISSNDNPSKGLVAEIGISEKNNDIQSQKSLQNNHINVQLISEDIELENLIGFSEFLQKIPDLTNSTNSQTGNESSNKNKNDFLDRKRNPDHSQSNINTSKNLFVTGKKPEHTKYSKDNIMKTMQSIINKKLAPIINPYLSKIKNEESLKKFVEGRELELLNLNVIKNKSSKKHFKELMTFSFREIFSNFTSNNYGKNKRSRNKELIDKLYELKENELKGNKCISNIIKFLDLKYHDFWKFLAFYQEDYAQKEEDADECYFRSEKKNDNIYNDREFFHFLLEIMEDFQSIVDDNLENEKEDYIKKFKKVMKDFHTLL